MTHWMFVNDAPSARPMEGRETATMLESSMIRDDTSEAVSRIPKLDGAAAWCWSVMAVISRSVVLPGDHALDVGNAIDLGVEAAEFPWASGPAGRNPRRTGTLAH